MSMVGCNFFAIWMFAALKKKETEQL